MEYELPLGEIFRLSVLISTAEKRRLRGAAQKETFVLGQLFLFHFPEREEFLHFVVVLVKRNHACDTISNDASALLQTNPLV